MFSACYLLVISDITFLSTLLELAD